jgi:maltodextrin utilization protein YvdJ
MSNFTKKLKQLYRQIEDTIFGFIVILFAMLAMIVLTPFFLAGGIIFMLWMSVIMVIRNFNPNNYSDIDEYEDKS